MLCGVRHAPLPRPRLIAVSGASHCSKAPGGKHACQACSFTHAPTCAPQNQPLVQENHEYQAWLASRLEAAQAYCSRSVWKL